MNYVYGTLFVFVVVVMFATAIPAIVLFFIALLLKSKLDKP